MWTIFLYKKGPIDRRYSLTRYYGTGWCIVIKFYKRPKKSHIPLNRCSIIEIMRASFYSEEARGFDPLSPLQGTPTPVRVLLA